MKSESGFSLAIAGQPFSKLTHGNKSITIVFWFILKVDEQSKNPKANNEDN